MHNAPMTPMSRRASGVAAALLAAAIMAVLGLRALGLPVAVGPQASPTAVPPSPTTGLPSPSASEDALGVFARIEQQVSDLRELPPAEIGPPDILTRDELVVELKALFDEAWSGGQLARDNLTLRAMGLLTEGQDIRQLTESLYAGQVLGFYDFEEKRMVVVTDAGLTPEAQVTYAHEFTHAMQDATFGTGKEHRPQSEDDDAALARLALEEGDATVAMLQWATRHLTAEQLAEIAATPQPDTSSVPRWMIRQLEFPYVSGAQLVTQLWASGGWEAVDAAYGEPPESTEQVMHPEKLLADEAPVLLPDPELAEMLGDGWHNVESSTIGESMLGIWLEELGIGGLDAANAAQGWGGDRLSIARGPNGAWVMAWQIAWDTRNEATEFEDIHGAISADLPFATEIERASGTKTLILHASAGALLDQVREFLD
jgi:hypothetical protein